MIHKYPSQREKEKVKYLGIKIFCVKGKVMYYVFTHTTLLKSFWKK